MNKLRAHIDRMAGFDRFLTVEEIDHELHRLHESARDLTRLEVIGQSRAGHPLHMLSLGRGARNALVIGIPHPNEPIGALSQIRLIETLLRDQELSETLGLVWNFVPCADPDGARLNHGWYAGPFDRLTYATHMYRPPFDEQFEWTFHRSTMDPPGLPAMSESRAVMEIIDTLRPEYLCSMHNSEVGGMYCYVTDLRPDLRGSMGLLRAATGMPIELGEPEEPADMVGPGIFHSPANLMGGEMLCSTDYAGRYDTFGIMAEPPLWATTRSEDATPTTQSRGELHRLIKNKRQSVAQLYSQWYRELGAQVDLDTPLGRAVTSDACALTVDWGEPVGNDNDYATVAYASSMTCGFDLERIRAAGHLVRVLKAELDRNGLDSNLQNVLSEATDALAQWTATSDDTVRFVGLTESVKCHAGLAIAGAFGLSRT